MQTVFTILGVLLATFALRDLFQTLFHPAARGPISDWIGLTIWRILRRFFPKALAAAGPLAFASVVLYWMASIVLGFALLYLPHLPHKFTFVQGLNPANYGSFLGAVNVSLSSLMTLSSGAYSKSLWIQFFMSIESVFGFGLLTASISWILSIYPVLEHRRSLAHQATLLHFAEHKGIQRLDNLSDSELQEFLLGFSSMLTTHRNELTQFPITYFFAEPEAKTSLAGILPYLADIAEEFANRKGGVALAAATLGGAIDDFLALIAGSFLRKSFGRREDILIAFAEDHGRKPARSPRHRLPKAA